MGISFYWNSLNDIEGVEMTKIKRPSILLETFEEGFSQWTSGGARYTNVTIRQTTMPEPVRFGNHALQLQYDFLGTVGISGAYVLPQKPIPLEDYPTAIGMWVYGNGKGHWLRAQLRDGDNQAFTIDFARHVNWKGWKYVEALIPPGKPTPLTLEIAVRLMETEEEKKSAGSIYIDHIQAIYGESDADLIQPTIFNEYPKNHEVIKMNLCKLGAFAKDNDGGTGVNPNSIWMELDGVKVDHHYVEETGEVFYTPPDPLLDGFHQVKIALQDHFGNEAEHCWQFKVDSGYVGIIPKFPDEAYIGEEFAVIFYSKRIYECTELFLHLSFDPNQIQVHENHFILHDKLKKFQIVQNEITKSGDMYLKIADLQRIPSWNSFIELAKLSFTIRTDIQEPIQINFMSGYIIKDHKKIPLFMPPLLIQPNAQLFLSVDRTTLGFPSTMKVSDEEGRPVQNATIYLFNDGKSTLGMTNNNGFIITNDLTKRAGVQYIQAQKDNKYSFLEKVNVLPPLGSQEPKWIHLTESGNHITATWTTSPLYTKSVLQYVPTKEYERNGFKSPFVQEIKGNSTFHSFDQGEIQVHHVMLEPLEKRESYTYRVGDGTESGWSEVFQLPMIDRNAEDFTFLVLGDTQLPPTQTEKGYGVYKELLKNAKEEYKDLVFIVHVGDMVDDGHLYSHWNAFFEAMADPTLAPTTPLVPVIGNHEHMGKGKEHFKQLFSLPPNGTDGLKGTVYSFDYGHAHFAVLNTETSKEELIQQGNWLIKDMAQTTKKWKIVLLHRSPYFANPTSGSEMVKDVFTKVFDECGVDLVISGHDHTYVRTYPLKSGEIHEKGTTYLIAGSTGHKFYGTVRKPYMEVYFTEKTQIYTAIQVTNEYINLEVTTRDGRVIDRHQIQK